MPIKKIIVSEDLLKKLEQLDNPVIVVGIPTGTAPSATGDYVLHEVQQKYPFVTVASTTGSTISFVAVEAKKEKMKLKNVKLHLGLPPSLDFEWEKDKK
jgi:hypothetical protein